MQNGLSLADDLDALLRHVLEKRSDLVFAADHGRGLRNIALQMDGVEHAAGGAQTAADAAVRINHTHATAQAAAGFRLDLLFGEGETVMLEGAGLLGIVKDRLAGGTVE